MTNAYRGFSQYANAFRGEDWVVAGLTFFEPSAQVLETASPIKSLFGRFSSNVLGTISGTSPCVRSKQAQPLRQLVSCAC